MTTAAEFVQRVFTNRDRIERHQLAIHVAALRWISELAKCPLRVGSLEPFVLRFFYIFNATFSSPGKTRGEIILLCSEALRIAKGWPDKHAHNPEEWVTAALDSLLKQGLLYAIRRSTP